MKATGAKPALAKALVAAASTENEIRCRAYQIYEERGKIEGHELEDWLRAEAEIMTHRVTRKAS